MKVNILARPDHSLKLYENLISYNEIYPINSIDLYTFYCLRGGSFFSGLFPKLKKSPPSANTLDRFTFSARIATIICKRFGLNFRQAEIFLLRHLAPWEKILNADLLHYWPFYCAEKINEAKRNSGIKTVAEYYEAEPSFVNEIYRASLDRYGLSFENPINMMINQNQAFEYETNFIVGSDFTKKSYLRKYPKANIHVCSYGPSGFRLNNTPKKLSGKSFPLKLVFVGQVCVEKGIDVLLETIKELNVSLDLVGPIRAGQEKIFSKLISISNNCTYHGPKRHSEVLEMLERFDVFCLPSLADNYSLAVVEALSRGMPVIVTNNCGNAGDVLKFNLGSVANTNCINSLQEAIDNMKTDFDFELFSTGVKDFFSDENIKSYPNSVLSVYKEIIHAQ